MRQIAVACLGRTASVIGMGCASLGSRVGRREGVRSLDRAFEAGVTWFDVAPSYGDAEAEYILGEFVQKKRDEIQICTKVGLLPAQTPHAMRAVKPIMRLAVDAFPSLRKYVARARPTVTKLPLTAEQILSSIDASLRRLGTEYVDVLALHGAEAEEVVRDEILTALQRVVSLGKAKAVSIASTLEVGLSGIAHSNIYGIIQVPNNPFEPFVVRAAGRLPAGRRLTFVTHSAYGAFGALSRLCKTIESDTTKLQILRDGGYGGGIDEAAATFLADYALATNAEGITLFSMLIKKHLEFNTRRLNQLPSKESVDKLAQVLIE